MGVWNLIRMHAILFGFWEGGFFDQEVELSSLRVLASGQSSQKEQLQ